MVTWVWQKWRFSAPQQEKTEREQRLYDLRKKLSNSEMFINEAIEIARNIQYYWDSSDLETKLKLQKTVFPKGLVIVPSHRGYLTRNVNDFFRRIPVFTRVLNWGKIKKVTVSGDFPLLVAGDQAISNFLEGYELVVDLWKYMNRRDD